MFRMPDKRTMLVFQEKSKVALVFGRESTGLTNEELKLMDFIIRIPANQNYPTLNISHAVGIILYTFYVSALCRLISDGKYKFLRRRGSLDRLYRPI